MKLPILAALACAAATSPVLAQDMPGMAMSDTDQPPAQTTAGSGTARLPGTDSPMVGLMQMAGDWMVMEHGYVTGQFTQATGPRGDDMAYSTSMLMVMGQRNTNWGAIELRSMLSLEPYMGPAGYPSLFTTGEEAHGSPLVDRQHPHDLFMELAARVTVNLGGDKQAFLYGGPVAEPALGPSAFMHRGSAAYNPDPPITHHWFDSTHITFGVVTAGLSGKAWQIETSAFRGQEPDDKRWNIESPRLDSWSIRATLSPTTRWTVQASYGQLHRPEASDPLDNEHRFTASAHYNNGKGFAAMLGFASKNRAPAVGSGRSLTAFIGEANWNIDRHNTIFGRLENVDNDELFPDEASPLHDQPFRVTKYQGGYARRFRLKPFELALGASLAGYSKPSVLDPWYGSDPISYTLFAKVSLVG